MSQSQSSVLDPLSVLDPPAVLDPAVSDPSLLLLVGQQNKSSGGTSFQTEDDRIELFENMKQISLGFEKAPSHVVATIDAAISVCQEWCNRPRGKDVPLPPPSLLMDRKVQVDVDKDYLPSLKSVTYTPSSSAPQSVLAMLAVKKENSQEEEESDETNDVQEKL